MRNLKKYNVADDISTPDSDYACYRSVAVKDPLTVARNVANRILTLPIYDGLELSSVEKICDIIHDLQKKVVLRVANKS